MEDQASSLPNAGVVKGEPISVIVRDQEGQEVHFKVKPTTKLQKVRIRLPGGAVAAR